jgi:flagellar hook-associated protein 2
VDCSGNGTNSIKGVSIAFNVNYDSLQAIMARITASSAGVTAAYDPVADKFSLVNKSTGNTGLTVSESAGGLLQAMGLNSTSTYQAGVDAQFSINGGPTLTSGSNTLDSTVTGISGLTINAASVSSQTVSVQGDTSGARSKIQDFINRYNDMQSYIDQQTKSTKGSDGKITVSTLTNNLDVINMSRNLRSMVFGANSSLTGSIKRLADIGIDFDGSTSRLTIKDSSKLDDALKNRGTDVEALFNNSTSGVATRVNAYVTQLTSSTGLIATQTSNITRQATSLDEQIARLNRQIDAEKARLTANFIAMENAQSRISSDSKAFSNAFLTNK